MYLCSPIVTRSESKPKKDERETRNENERYCAKPLKKEGHLLGAVKEATDALQRLRADGPVLVPQAPADRVHLGLSASRKLQTFLVTKFELWNAFSFNVC